MLAAFEHGGFCEFCAVQTDGAIAKAIVVALAYIGVICHPLGISLLTAPAWGREGRISRSNPQAYPAGLAAWPENQAAITWERTLRPCSAFPPSPSPGCSPSHLEVALHLPPPSPHTALYAWTSRTRSPRASDPAPSAKPASHTAPPGGTLEIQGCHSSPRSRFSSTAQRVVRVTLLCWSCTVILSVADTEPQLSGDWLRINVNKRNEPPSRWRVLPPCASSRTTCWRVTSRYAARTSHTCRPPSSAPLMGDHTPSSSAWVGQRACGGGSWRINLAVIAVSAPALSARSLRKGCRRRPKTHQRSTT